MSAATRNPAIRALHPVPAAENRRTFLATSHREHDAGKAHEHERRADPNHTELRAAYRFRCRAPSRLKSIEVRVFAHLRETEAIGVQLVTATGQTLSTLRPDAATVALERR